MRDAEAATVAAEEGGGGFREEDSWLAGAVEERRGGRGGAVIVAPPPFGAIGFAEEGPPVFGAAGGRSGAAEGLSIGAENPEEDLDSVPEDGEGVAFSNGEDPTRAAGDTGGARRPDGMGGRDGCDSPDGKPLAVAVTGEVSTSAEDDAEGTGADAAR